MAYIYILLCLPKTYFINFTLILTLYETFMYFYNKHICMQYFYKCNSIEQINQILLNFIVNLFLEIYY